MGYDFESDKDYNFESTVSMTLDTGKTCFSPGEYVNGSISLKPKQGNMNSFLQNPMATLYITEYSYYTFTVNELDPRTNMTHVVTKKAEENVPILTYPLDFSNFQNANINNGLKMPFTVQIPLRIYPSCFFGSNTFVKHYLCVEFPSIGAKKTSIIIIKNPPYFNNFNRLYQSPAMCYKEMKKHKLVFSQGSFTASIKVPKNAFVYDEYVPFEIDMDLTKMSLNIKNIKVSLRRTACKNVQYHHDQLYSKDNTTVAKKNVSFPKGQKKLHIEDVIIIDEDKNPKKIYKKLDGDNRKVSEKYSGIYIYPTCYGGLLSVEYFIKMEIEMDTFWSTNEEFLIPIDFFEPFANAPGANGPQQQQPYPPQQQTYPPQGGYGPQQQPYPQQQQPYPPQGGYGPQQQPYPPQQPYQPQPQQQPYPPQKQPYPPQQQPYPPQGGYGPQQPYSQPPYPPQEGYGPHQAYPPQQNPPPMSNVVPPSQQKEENNQDNLPTMDEIMKKPVENSDNPAPPSGGNNNYSYPSF